MGIRFLTEGVSVQIIEGKTLDLCSDGLALDLPVWTHKYLTEHMVKFENIYIHIQYTHTSFLVLSAQMCDGRGNKFRIGCRLRNSQTPQKLNLGASSTGVQSSLYINNSRLTSLNSLPEPGRRT